jgi:hypothetical protein
MHAYMRTHTHIHLRTQIHLRAHTHHTYTHINVRAHTHTYTVDPVRMLHVLVQPVWCVVKLWIFLLSAASTR